MKKFVLPTSEYTQGRTYIQMNKHVVQCSQKDFVDKFFKIERVLIHVCFVSFLSTSIQIVTVY